MCVSGWVERVYEDVCMRGCVSPGPMEDRIISGDDINPGGNVTPECDITSAYEVFNSCISPSLLTICWTKSEINETAPVR